MSSIPDVSEALARLATRVLGSPSAAGLQFHHQAGQVERAQWESTDGKTVIRGSSGPAMGHTLQRYLREQADTHLSWYGNRINRPASGRPPARGDYTSWARHRYFLNYCCFSYSLAHWDWPAWERLIDWMALQGINRPLAVTGQEAVWQRVGHRLGLTAAEMETFLAGPAYLPFGWMGCLDGWGGPLPEYWCRQHEELGQRILARERELGMTPVLQGFTGHVPAALLARRPGARAQTIHWHEWTTHLLDPLDPLFAEVAAVYAEEQARSFGTDHLYAADPFIEMVPPSGELDYLGQLGRAIYEGMHASDPQAIWVLQGWAFMDKRAFWTPPRLEAFLGAVPDDRMLVLDLHCEAAPMWNQTRAFAGKPWLWCNVQNFGRNAHLTAALTANNEDLQAVRRDPARGGLEGVGMVNEGLCYNPVAYDFLFEQAWREEPVDRQAWVIAYARNRYGCHSPPAEQAWTILRETVYDRFQPERSEHLRRPSEAVTAVAEPGHGRLEQAWQALAQADLQLGHLDPYRFDLVNTGRQVLSNRATRLKRALHDALALGDAVRFASLGQDLINTLLDMDDLVGTRPEFLLGCWLAEARHWGSTDAERRRLEEGARRQITIWGHTDILRDYARKEWSGLLRDFYAERWRRYVAAGAAALEVGQSFDPVAFERALLTWERQWIMETKTYPVEPQGDPIGITRRLLGRYGTPRDDIG